MYSRLCPLSERYVFDILTYVYEKDSVMATELQEIATNYRSLKKASADLVAAGLMDMTVVDDGRLKKIFTLTPKGKKIAKHLMQAKMEFGTEMIPSSDKEPWDDKD